MNERTNVTNKLNCELRGGMKIGNGTVADRNREQAKETYGSRAEKEKKLLHHTTIHILYTIWCIIGKTEIKRKIIEGGAIYCYIHTLCVYIFIYSDVHWGALSIQQ